MLLGMVKTPLWIGCKFGRIIKGGSKNFPYGVNEHVLGMSRK